ncbi:MAG: HAD family hydrolase [Erysipelotrichaceae bacterium]|nr:HAD family hydrolase [Erysipelotrichaceae bacterium]
MIKHILFDLDGTLLPMDQSVFIKGYFGALIKYFGQLGLDETAAYTGLKVSVKAMAQNEGSMLNEDVFWKVFLEYNEGDREELTRSTKVFYRDHFESVVRATCGFNPLSNEVIQLAKSKGYDVYLLTNPMFPKEATSVRVKCAGLDFNDFKEVTTYENYHFCKPNVAYFQEVMNKFQLDPTECLMIGNDVQEDTVVKHLGTSVYLVTDDLIDRNNTDISTIPHGSFQELIAYIQALPDLK